MADPSPLADIRRLVSELPPLAPPAGPAARTAATEQAGGRLAETASWLARAQGRARPAVAQPVVALFAGSHGVARRGVSCQPAAYAADLVAQLGKGVAPLNALCAGFGLGLKVFELALEMPTADLTAGPALDERALAATLAFGMEAVAGGADLLVLAGAGAGGETAAAALGAALRGGPAAEWTSDEDLPAHVRLRRAEAIDAALARHGAKLADPLLALRAMGGREAAAVAGAILAARTQGIPVILDGVAAAAAALVLHALRADAVAHCMLAQKLPEPKLAEAAAAAGLVPLLDLRLAEGEAGAVAASLAKAAVGIAMLRTA